MAVVGWGQEGAEGPGGDTVTQAVITEEGGRDTQTRCYQTEGQGEDSKWDGEGGDVVLTFGWEPSAMVEREKLSLCSSDGVRYLPGGGEESAAVRPGTPPSTPPFPWRHFGVNPVLGGGKCPPCWRSEG